MEDNHGWENHPVIDTEEAPSEHQLSSATILPKHLYTHLH